MSTEHTPNPADQPADRPDADERTYLAEDALPPIECDESAGWREEYAAMHCDPNPDPEDVTSS